MLQTDMTDITYRLTNSANINIDLQGYQINLVLCQMITGSGRLRFCLMLMKQLDDDYC